MTDRGPNTTPTSQALSSPAVTFSLYGEVLIASATTSLSSTHGQSNCEELKTSHHRGHCLPSKATLHWRKKVKNVDNKYIVEHSQMTHMMDVTGIQRKEKLTYFELDGKVSQRNGTISGV